MRALILILVAVILVSGCPQQHVTQQKVVIGAEATSAEPAAVADEKVAAKPSPNLQLVTSTFKVEGMDCADCSKAIENKLIGLPGVSTVSADDKRGTTIVQYDSGKITPDEIIAAIGTLKFKASLARP